MSEFHINGQAAAQRAADLLAWMERERRSAGLDLAQARAATAIAQVWATLAVALGAAGSSVVVPGPPAKLVDPQ